MTRCENERLCKYIDHVVYGAEVHNTTPERASDPPAVRYFARCSLGKIGAGGQRKEQGKTTAVDLSIVVYFSERGIVPSVNCVLLL